MNLLFQSMSAADFQACCVKMLIYRSIYQVGQLIVEVGLKEKLGSRIYLIIYTGANDGCEMKIVNWIFSFVKFLPP